MSSHPDPKLDKAAKAQANRGDKQPHIWWAEYRTAYANAAGLGDDVPVEPDAALQAYLTKLDEKGLELDRDFRAKLRDDAQ